MNATTTKALLLALLLLPAFARAQAPATPPADEPPAYGAELEGFPQPFPLARHAFTSQGLALSMGYLDVAPTAAANGRTAVLLHGKNFCAATWEDTIRALAGAGFRVIAPDQVGFCTATKPAYYQYSFQQLAANTRALLEKLGVSKSVVIGHSTGGMLALRYALMFPGSVERLVLVNPIGLEDWKAAGVPYIGVDGWLAREAKVSADSIRAYERATYYAGTWQPQYDKWVEMLAGLYRGPGRDEVARNSALIYDMIFNQPVVYELRQVKVPTTLMVGSKDTTAIGKDLAPPEVRDTLGNYPVLARRTAERIADSRLIEFPELGHAPQIQAPAEFHKALLEALGR